MPPEELVVTKKGKKKRKKKRKRDSKDEEQDVEDSAKRQKLSNDPQALKDRQDTSELADKPDQPSGSPAKSKRKKKKKKKDRRVKKPPAQDDANPKPSQESKEEVDGENSKDEEVTTVASFPYPTDPDDHCESPFQAYAHIQPLLLQLQAQNGKSKRYNNEDLRIYDPYFCDGAVIENLASLGFPSVYNKKEDCYQVWASSSYPNHDVFVTNPPYSSDHIEKLIQHLTTDPKMQNKPWFLLMPDWVHKKDYFVGQMKRHHIQPFYLVPKKRYVYLPPKNYREAKKSDVHKKSSPFNSMWYIWGGSQQHTERLIQHYYSRNCLFPTVDTNNKIVEGAAKLALSQACDLARSKSALRDLRRKVKKR